MDPEIQQLLDEGIALLRAERKSEARRKLMQVINADERNEHAWLYLSEVVDTDEDRRICLENVLAINPANERAETALKTLEERAAQGAGEEGQLICPACGATNLPDSPRCLNCYASLEDAVAVPPPLPDESAEDEEVVQERLPRQAEPKGFMELLDTWAEMLALPKKERLDEEHAYARWGLVVPGILIASGIAYFFTLLTNAGRTMFLLAGGAPDLTQVAPYACGGAVGGAVIGLISFFISSGLFYLVARLFKGEGEFIVQSYLLSLVFGPFSLVLGIVSPLTLLGVINPVLISIPLLIYISVSILALIMSVRALRSAHGYGTGAALGTIFLPGIVLGCIMGPLVSLLAILPLGDFSFTGPGFPTEGLELETLPPSDMQLTPRADIPIPEEANVIFSSAAFIQYDIFQSPEAVGAYYQTQMPAEGWTPDPQNFIGAEVVRLTYTKPGASVFIQASLAGDRTRVDISISEF